LCQIYAQTRSSIIYFSRSPVAKAAARSLLNTTTRLQRPFHRFQLVKNDHAEPLQLNLKDAANSEDNESESSSLWSIASGLKRLEAKLDKLGTNTRGASVHMNGAREEDPESMEIFPPQKGVGARRRSSQGRKEEDCNAKKDSETFNSDYESDSQNEPKKGNFFFEFGSHKGLFLDENDESSQELTESLPLEAPDSGEESGGEDMEEDEAEMEKSFEVIPSKIRRLEEPPSNYRAISLPALVNLPKLTLLS